jgi:hypothetical protein
MRNDCQLQLADVGPQLFGREAIVNQLNAMR